MGGGISSESSDTGNVQVLLRSTSLRERSVRDNVRSKFSQLSSHSEISQYDDEKHDKLNDSTGDMPALRMTEDIYSTRPTVSDAHTHETNKQTDTMTMPNEEMLNKLKILELVHWMLRLSTDTRRNDTIISIFSNCLDETTLLTFEEFCTMYEEIATRVELEKVFDKKFSDMDMQNRGYLERPEITVLTDFILSKFAQIWCSKRDIVEMKRKLVSLFEELPGSGKMSKVELFEVYDGMLVSIRLIHKTKKKMKEYDTDRNGTLDEKELLSLADWILKSYVHSGIEVTEDMREEMRAKILATYDENNDSVIGIRELAKLFESIMEKKRWFYSLNTMTNTVPNASAPRVAVGKKARRRLSVHTFNEISEAVMSEIGISPLVREKFNELDYTKRGTLDQASVLELLDFMYLESPSEGLRVAQEFTEGWEGDVVVSPLCPSISVNVVDSLVVGIGFRRVLLDV